MLNVFKPNNYSIFILVYKFVPYLSIKMSDHKLEIQKLFSRLQEAKKVADDLKAEVIDIRNQIKVLQKAALFNKNLNKDLEHVEEEIDSAPKKQRLDFAFDEDDYLVVYTDGACENNGNHNAKAGIGVWFNHNHPLNISKAVEGRATNNTAEIQACIEALKVAKENEISKVKINTDSEFTINCMTKWIHNWKKKNWKLASGGPVKNKEDLEKLDKLCQKFQIKWNHVAAHAGIIGNEEADKLARAGAQKYYSSK